MEENEYRSLYHDLNNQRCVFEKALNSRQCRCHQSRHFLLAGREGYGCHSAEGLAQCAPFLELIRSKARFALGITRADEPLPHNKEIRVQVGSCQGLAAALNVDTSPASPPDIHALLTQALEIHGEREALPFDELMKAIVSFKGRQRRKQGR